MMIFVKRFGVDNAVRVLVVQLLRGRLHVVEILQVRLIYAVFTASLAASHYYSLAPQVHTVGPTLQLPAECGTDLSIMMKKKLSKCE